MAIQTVNIGTIANDGTKYFENVYSDNSDNSG